METFNGVKKSHLHFVARKPRKSWGLGPSLTCDKAPDIVFTQSTTYLMYTSGKPIKNRVHPMLCHHTILVLLADHRIVVKTWYRLVTKRKVVGIFNRPCMPCCPTWNQAMTYSELQSRPYLSDLGSRRARCIRNDLLAQNTRISSVQGKPFTLLLGAGEERIKLLHVIDGYLILDVQVSRKTHHHIPHNQPLINSQRRKTCTHSLKSPIQHNPRQLPQPESTTTSHLRVEGPTNNPRTPPALLPGDTLGFIVARTLQLSC